MQFPSGFSPVGTPQPGAPPLQPGVVPQPGMIPQAPQPPQPGQMPDAEAVAKFKQLQQQQAQQQQQQQKPPVQLNDEGLPMGFHKFNMEDDAPEMAWSQVLQEAINNAPSSAVQYAQDTAVGTAQALFHPVETVKAIGNLLTGIVQKAVPGQQGQEVFADQLFDDLADRYGTLENFKKTVAEDPIGVIADVSSTFIPSGAALKGLGTVAKLKKLESLGKKFLKAAPNGELIWSIPKGTTKLTTVIPRTGISKWLMSVSLKSSKETAQTALDKGILPTAKGADKLRKEINRVGNEVNDAINNLDANGVKIPVGALMKDFRPILKSAKEESQMAYKQVKGVMDDLTWLSKEQAQRGFLKPSVVQAKKRTTYKRLKRIYEGYMDATASQEAKMAIAKAGKEVLEKHGPELIGLNEELSKYVELDKVIRRSVNNASKSTLLNMVAPAYAMGRVAGPKGQAMMVGLKAISSSPIRAKLAQGMDRFRKQGLAMNEGKLKDFVTYGANARHIATMAERLDNEEN